MKSWSCRQIRVWAAGGLVITLLAAPPAVYSWGKKTTGTAAGKRPAAESRSPDRALAEAQKQVAKARTLWEKGKGELALTALSKAIAIDPSLVEAWLEIANIHIALQASEKALMALDEGIKLAEHQGCEPELYGRALCQRARLRAAAGQFDQAAGDLVKAVGVVPNDPEPQFAIGEIQAGRGQTEPAFASFRKALRVDSHHVASWWAMSQLALEKKRLDVIQEAYDGLVLNDTNKADSYKRQLTAAHVKLRPSAPGKPVATTISGKSGEDPYAVDDPYAVEGTPGSGSASVSAPAPVPVPAPAPAPASAPAPVSTSASRPVVSPGKSPVRMNKVVNTNASSPASRTPASLSGLSNKLPDSAAAKMVPARKSTSTTASTSESSGLLLPIPTGAHVATSLTAKSSAPGIVSVTDKHESAPVTPVVTPVPTAIAAPAAGSPPSADKPVPIVESALPVLEGNPSPTEEAASSNDAPTATNPSTEPSSPDFPKDDSANIVNTEIDSLMNQLMDNDDSIKGQARAALVAMGEKAAPKLSGALAHPDPAMRGEAIDLLASLGDAGKRYIPAIRESLNDPDPNVQEKAKRALSWFSSR
ncbi:MAG: tetratricopeptide repeat protein [Candidatus Riflebacteria bacterium]|nr:tetratricopeptide repeat protein [Candidatus Riflebacteria bacterium]